MAAGAVALLRPTDLIIATGDKRTIDGVEFEFQMAPNSEAPAEMHFFIPRYKLLNLAENCTHNFHNLLPFRGADVRDALAWSKYLGEALQMWGGKADAMCGQHHWPVWGHERIDTMIRQQRDLYKFAHDQTIRLMNHGLTATEIAEAIRLPASLDGAWHGRGYYGHIRHNVKAIYQKYLGWYDANPVNLDPLPPVESGKKYVEYMGGADAILARAAKDFAKGEFRFVAQAVSHLVFADPDNQAARAMLADTFEQLGYASESSTWRNAYLFGAQELRQGMPKVPPRSTMPRETLAALRTEQLWDVLGVRLNGPKAEGKRIVLNWNFTDTNETFVLNLENCALTYAAGAQAADADASFTLARGVLDEVIAKLTTFPEAVASGKIKVSRQSDAARRVDDADGRVPADVRDRRAETDGGELTNVGWAKRTCAVPTHPSCHIARRKMVGTAVRFAHPTIGAMSRLQLLRAADQLDARLGFLHQAAIGGEIVERHAARGEAGFELLADGGPVQRGKTVDHGNRAGLVFHDEAGETGVDDLRDRAAVIGDHRRAAGHGFDHHEAERLRPVDRHQQADRAAEEIGFLAVADLADIFDQRIGLDQRARSTRRNSPGRRDRPWPRS